MKRTKRKSNNPKGGPSRGLTAKVPPISASPEMITAMKSRAEQLGVTASEAWRRAAAAWLESGRPGPETDEQTRDE